MSSQAPSNRFRTCCLATTFSSTNATSATRIFVQERRLHQCSQRLCTSMNGFLLAKANGYAAGAMAVFAERRQLSHVPTKFFVRGSVRFRTFCKQRVPPHRSRHFLFQNIIYRSLTEKATLTSTLELLGVACTLSCVRCAVCIPFSSLLLCLLFTVKGSQIATFRSSSQQLL